MLRFLESSGIYRGYRVKIFELEPVTFRQQPKHVESRHFSQIAIWTYPSVNHGTSIDGGVLSLARAILRNLRKSRDSIETVFVGDAEGQFAIVAKQVAENLKCDLGIIPEGLGVFRGVNEDYPWIIRGWRSAAGLIVRDSALEMRDFLRHKLIGTDRRWRRRLRLGWRIWRVAQLVTFRPTLSIEQSKITHFDLAVSNWPSDLSYGFSVGAWHSLPNLYSDTTGGHCPLPQGQSTLFIHESAKSDINSGQFEQILRSLNLARTDFICIAPDRNKINLEAFCEAIKVTFPDSEVILLDGLTPVETVCHRMRPRTVVGTTSTALLNLALQRPAGVEVVSCARIARRVLEPHGSDEGNYFLNMLASSRLDSQITVI